MIDALDAGFGPHPVATEFGLAAHLPLGFSQLILVTLEAVQGLAISAIGEGGETLNAHVDANSTG
ncbi:hypothetical protein D3C84_1216550 [compost metagenome]